MPRIKRYNRIRKWLRIFSCTSLSIILKTSKETTTGMLMLWLVLHPLLLSTLNMSKPSLTSKTLISPLISMMYKVSSRVIIFQLYVLMCVNGINMSLIILIMVLSLLNLIIMLELDLRS